MRIYKNRRLKARCSVFANDGGDRSTDSSNFRRIRKFRVKFHSQESLKYMIHVERVERLTLTFCSCIKLKCALGERCILVIRLRPASRNNSRGDVEVTSK